MRNAIIDFFFWTTGCRSTADRAVQIIQNRCRPLLQPTSTFTIPPCHFVSSGCNYGPINLSQRVDCRAFVTSATLPYIRLLVARWPERLPTVAVPIAIQKQTRRNVPNESDAGIRPELAAVLSPIVVDPDRAIEPKRGDFGQFRKPTAFVGARIVADLCVISHASLLRNGRQLRCRHRSLPHNLPKGYPGDQQRHCANYE